uniref:Uncharacterized LOC100186470 n=1 Tax=Ciona intestinalis TaxID=7719 RepID=F6YSX1_CIOIN
MNKSALLFLLIGLLFLTNPSNGVNNWRRRRRWVWDMKSEMQDLKDSEGEKYWSDKLADRVMGNVE